MNFSAGEKVLCYHGPLIYQAKVLEAEIWTGVDPSEGGFTGPHYFVHYQGWKQSWDEWVPESRMLKLNDENIARQKALVAAAKQKAEAAKEAASASSSSNAAASSSAKAGASTSSASRSRPRDSDETSAKRRNATGGASGDAARGAKRARGAGSADVTSGSGTGANGSAAAASLDDEYLRKPEIKIVIPDSLKVQLVDDWENVTKKNMLVQLPKKPNVREVLKLYRDNVVQRKKAAKASSSSGSNSTGSSSSSAGPATNTPLAVVDEVLQGLEVYFDKSLGNNLLYRFERQQFLQHKKGGGAAAAGEAAGGEAEKEQGSNAAGKSKADDRQPSEIYGAEHLLRLFVNLPSIIAHTTMDSESVGILREHLDDFLAFMVREKAKLFGKYYIESSPEYSRLSGI